MILAGGSQENEAWEEVGFFQRVFGWILDDHSDEKAQATQLQLF